ncbi:hypothetical protein Anapl_13148 [Anas platyrhynchos]|uniref:Uncharacterized protein n=1 Tax=Anas platyrhynchos TaxID=8839 RepID=R0K7Z2_ANAPL|nr:hypothetical protein Anapl_13148 [Anas platyrhynchos]
MVKRQMGCPPLPPRRTVSTLVEIRDSLNKRNSQDSWELIQESKRPLPAFIANMGSAYYPSSSPKLLAISDICWAASRSLFVSQFISSVWQPASLPQVEEHIFFQYLTDLRLVITTSLPPFIHPATPPRRSFPPVQVKILCLERQQQDAGAYRHKTFSVVIQDTAGIPAEGSILIVLHPTSAEHNQPKLCQKPMEQVQKKKEDPCFSLWDQGLSKAQCWFYLFDLLKQDLEDFLPFPATSLSELPIYSSLLHGYFILPEQGFSVFMQEIVICAAGAVACGRPDAQLCSKAKVCVLRNLFLIFVAAKEILINVTQTPADSAYLLLQQKLGKLQPAMAEPPPRTQTFHTTTSHDIVPPVFAAGRGTSDSSHLQPCVPATFVPNNIHLPTPKLCCFTTSQRISQNSRSNASVVMH